MRERHSGRSDVRDRKTQGHRDAGKSLRRIQLESHAEWLRRARGGQNGADQYAECDGGFRDYHSVPRMLLAIRLFACFSVLKGLTS